MTKIDELQKKYPTIPREIIVKWEVLRNGVRDSHDLDKICHVVRAPNFSYQSYDQDVSLRDLASKRPEGQQSGYVQTPATLFMKNGMGVKIQRSTRSPYTIRDLGTGKFGLFEGEEQVDLDIYFLSTKSDVMEEPLTSRGTPVFTLIDQRRWCFAMMPVRYCEYFATGDQCKFCNFNGTQDDARAIGLERAVTINPDDAVE
ncbi:MAG: hypothetical protein Q7O66_04090, partial [Dehalococcoidia bacterium]|nr:hypothetical protein [Dehalococcoidia bacterium]